jgi:hypothetical protein
MSLDDVPEGIENNVAVTKKYGIKSRDISIGLLNYQTKGQNLSNASKKFKFK